MFAIAQVSLPQGAGLVAPAAMPARTHQAEVEPRSATQHCAASGQHRKVYVHCKGQTALVPQQEDARERLRSTRHLPQRSLPPACWSGVRWRLGLRLQPIGVQGAAAQVYAKVLLAWPLIAHGPRHMHGTPIEEASSRAIQSSAIATTQSWTASIGSEHSEPA